MFCFYIKNNNNNNNIKQNKSLNKISFAVPESSLVAYEKTLHFSSNPQTEWPTQERRTGAFSRASLTDFLPDREAR